MEASIIPAEVLALGTAVTPLAMAILFRRGLRKMAPAVLEMGEAMRQSKPFVSDSFGLLTRRVAAALILNALLMVPIAAAAVFESVLRLPETMKTAGAIGAVCGYLVTLPYLYFAVVCKADVQTLSSFGSSGE